MTLATFGTTAASYLPTLDNRVGQAFKDLEKGVKNYGFAETLFTATAILASVEVLKMSYRGACNSWKKGNVGTAAAWSSVAIGSIFLGGWEGCRAVRNGLTEK